jgi:ankyrin repeat protein
MNKLYAIFSLVIFFCMPLQVLSMGKDAQQQIFNVCVEQAMKTVFQSPEQPDLSNLESSFKIMENLDLSGLDVNVLDSNGGSLLHSAAVLGSLKYVKLLIENGAKPSMSCKERVFGNTPLHIAAWYGRTEIVRYLLEQGSDKWAKNNRDNFPVALAAFQHNSEAVQLLRASFN